MNLRRLWIPKLGGWIFGSSVALASIGPLAEPGAIGGIEKGLCTGSHEATCVNSRGSACFVPGKMPDACEVTMNPTAPLSQQGSIQKGAFWPCPVGCTTPNGQPGGNACSKNNSCYY